ncbi:MAG: hypothetical protein GXO66_09705 [Euryarchaeota archaeon]|nr:hypothetical protein [Euryarchaeota archaeon]
MRACSALLLILLLVGVVRADVIQVTSSSGCVAANATFSDPGEAVLNSGANDTIILCPGVYELSSLTIDKPLKIAGHLRGTAVLNLSTPGYSNRISILADGVELRNLTVVSGGVNVYALYIRGRNITVEDVAVEDGFWYGFYIVSSRNVVLKRVRVRNMAEAALEVRDTTGLILEDSTLVRESSTSSQYTGRYVALYNVSGSTIRNNSIFGVVRDRSDGYDSGFAIYLNSSSGNTVAGNFVRRVSYCIFFDDPSSGNIFYNNYFECGTPPCRDNLGGVNHYNTSRRAGLNIVGGGTLQGNYWGGLLPYSGSDLDGDGIGDTQLPYNATKPQDGVTYILGGGDWGPLIKQRETSPPVVVSVNLLPDQEVATCTDLNLTVTSYAERIEACTLELDGRQLPMNVSGGSYIYYCSYRLCPADFSGGYLPYRVTVRDSANNTADSGYRGLLVNASPALILIHSPRDGAAYNVSTLPLEVGASDGVSQWTYSLDGGANTSFTPNTTITAGEGSHLLEVYARDSAGYLIYRNSSFTVDLTPPSISLTSPLNGSIYTTRNVTLNGTSTEEVSWSYVLNGRSGYPSGLPASLSADEGANRLLVRAVDRAGNAAVAEVSFTVDTSPPTAASSAGSSVRVDVNSSYNLSWRLYDNLAGGYYRLLLNGSPLVDWRPWSNATAVEAAVDTSRLVEYVYTLEFNDSAGWLAVSRVVVDVIDPSPPVINITSPADGALYSTAQLLINATADRAVHTWLWSLNGSQNQSFTPPAVVNLTSDGTYVLDIWANSTSGAMGHASVSFSVDTTPPAVVIASPANATYADTRVPLRVSAGERVLNWSYRLNGGPEVGFTPNTTIAAAAGQNHLVVYALDSAGNRGSASVYFTVSPPSPSPGGGGGGGAKQSTRRLQLVLKDAEAGGYTRLEVERWNISEVLVKPRHTVYYGELVLELLEAPPEAELEGEVYLSFRLVTRPGMLEEARIRFGVDEVWLRRLNLSPEDVGALYLTSEGWKEVAVRRAGVLNGTLLYELVLHEPGRYAVVASPPIAGADRLVDEEKPEWRFIPPGTGAAGGGAGEVKEEPGVSAPSPPSPAPENGRSAGSPQEERGGICGPTLLLLVSLVPLLGARLLRQPQPAE